MPDPQPVEDGCTREEVAAVLGVSIERVRQIELAALRKCRTWCRRRGWRFEDLVPAWPSSEQGRQGVKEGEGWE
jgi:hypothetical protein